MAEKGREERRNTVRSGPTKAYYLQLRRDGFRPIKRKSDPSLEEAVVREDRGVQRWYRIFMPSAPYGTEGFIFLYGGLICVQLAEEAVFKARTGCIHAN